MAIDNPEDNSLAALWRLVKRLASANPLNNGSVDRGALTIRSEEGLVVGEAEGKDAGKGSARVNGTVHVMRGGRVVSSDAGDENFSMQMFYEGGRGNVVAQGVPMRIQAWDSIIDLNENGLQIQGGDGNAITMSADGMQIIGPGGGAGAWIELKGGDIFLRNLPDS